MKLLNVSRVSLYKAKWIGKTILEELREIKHLATSNNHLYEYSKS